MTSDPASIADEAQSALHAARVAEARRLFEEAASAEADAFQQTPPSKPRTRGILAVSAAALWYKAHAFKEAELSSHHALRSSTLPLFARKELKELLQTIWNEQAQEEAGVSFAPDKLLVSVKGGQVVTGGAPLDLIVSKVQTIQNMFFRTVEYMMNIPVRAKGSAPKAIQERYRLWLFQSVPGSYQFELAVQKPAQGDIFDDEHIGSEALTRKFLSIVSACTNDPEFQLPEEVDSEAYRSVFLKMTRNLAPNGETFSSMEIKNMNAGKSIVLSTSTRKAISGLVQKNKQSAFSDETVESLKGNLRALDLDRNWLDIAVDGDTVRVDGLNESVDDIIGPMINHDVIIQVTRSRRGKVIFRDIELDD